MKVKLLQHTNLDIVDTAISKSHNKQVPSYKKINRINRVANEYKHGSVVEHLVYTFDIDSISRACLQELVRHRIASYTVKSTRYTLKELKDEEPFQIDSEMIPNADIDRAKKYLVFTNVPVVNEMSIKALENLRQIISYGISNDKAKYCLPEAYKTSLVITINARSLQNFLKLRSAKSALWEIRELALRIYSSLPEDHKFLYVNVVKGVKDEES